MTIKLRFAPSPTGKPHIGLIRTAMINYVYAKQNHGKLLLRFEDTDKSRNTRSSYKAIIDALRWCDIEIENIEQPFMQSQRSGLYRKTLSSLLENKTSRNFLYKCRCVEKHLPSECVRDRDLESKGAIRFDVETFISRYGSKLTVNDLVLGEVDFDLAHLNHFVMARSNGDYLYIFTNLVDDISMKITHVIRGMDLLNSTPAQILLKKLLDSIGTESQKIHYGHIPLIKRKGGGKLSKRDSESDFFSYIKSGYLPEAIINYLILIGWGSSDDRELFQLDEFIKFFDLKKLGRSSAFLDLDKLRSINSLYINQLDDGAFLFRYREYVRSYSDSENREKILNDDLQKKLSKLVPVVKSRVKNFAEVEMYIKPLLIASSELLQHRRELEIEAHDSRERVQDALSALAQIPNGEKCREIMIALDKQERRAIRYILAASNVTIPLNDLIAVLGGEIIEERRRVFTSLF